MVHFVSVPFFETKFFEISFRLCKNFDRFALRNRHKNFGYDQNSSKFFQKISILRPTIEKDRNLFWSISLLRPTIEIFWNSFWSFSIKKWSKFFEIFSKNFEIGHFISNFVSFRKQVEMEPRPKFRNILVYLSHQNKKYIHKPLMSQYRMVKSLPGDLKSKIWF